MGRILRLAPSGVCRRAAYPVQRVLRRAGWNVKFRKGSRAICTNYPRRGYFTCLVCIGGREAAQAELLLPACGSYVRELYFSVQPFNGARWLMINVDSPAVLNDLKRLVSARMGTPKARKATNEI